MSRPSRGRRATGRRRSRRRHRRAGARSGFPPTYGAGRCAWRAEGTPTTQAGELLPMRPTLRLAFSPDSDDIFMFWPLLAGKVDPEGLAFSSERADTETLNARAAAADIDV